MSAPPSAAFWVGHVAYNTTQWASIWGTDEVFCDALLEHRDPTTPGLDLARDGTGLGLYFAGRVAAAHRTRERCGRIELTNGPAGGAVFTMRLP